MKRILFLFVLILWLLFTLSKENYYTQPQSNVQLTDNLSNPFLSNNNTGYLAVSINISHTVWHSTDDVKINFKRNKTRKVEINNISSEILSAYSQLQNNHNPFIPTINIKYTIPKSRSA